MKITNIGTIRAITNFVVSFECGLTIHFDNVSITKASVIFCEDGMVRHRLTGVKADQFKLEWSKIK